MQTIEEPEPTDDEPGGQEYEPLEEEVAGAVVKLELEPVGTTRLPTQATCPEEEAI
jgi:hypothetical protein